MRAIFPISSYPRPHTPLGRPHSTVYRVGASSRATFKYSAVLLQRRHDFRVVLKPKPSEHDAKSIQDTIEGLRLMSLLKCVHFLLFLTQAPLTKLDSGVPRHRHTSTPPSPTIQARVWPQWPPPPPQDQLIRHRDACVHAPQFRRPPDPRIRGLARRSEPR